MIRAEVTTKDLTDDLTRLTTRAETAVARVVFDAGAQLQTLVRAKASTGFHRRGLPHIPGTGPGPNVATGDYLRSISLATGYAGGVAVAVVSTNAPQARRLEYGFTGVDSLGRAFRQPPYPHWRPAVEEIRPEFEQALRAAAKGIA